MVKKVFLLFASLAICAFSTIAQTTIEDSFKVDGIYRSYRFYIPALITQDMRPLVLNMHGLGSDAIEQQYYSNFMPIADTAGFYIVMPQGTSYNGTTFWNVGFPGSPQVDDVKFLSALIDTLAKRYPIDKGRVYATGMSNGGYMSHLLGIVLNNKIAAIASVTGSIVPQIYATASPGRSVPAMQVHGTADATVPYAGSSIGMPIDSVVGFWVRNNGCNAVPVQTAVPNTNMADGSTATRFVWNGGKGGATVELFRVTGGGHTWPGAPFIIGVTNQDFSASREIWRFFSQYKLSQFTAVERVRLETGSLYVSPNPASGTLHIISPFKGTSAIFDFTGKMMLRSDAKDIDVSAWPGGIYLLEYSNATQSGAVRFIKE